MNQPSSRSRPWGLAARPGGSGGFTLIEMLIAVAIIGILASVAIPGYQRYVENSRRVDAQSTLMEIASIAERCYTSRYSYDNCTRATGLAASESQASSFYDYSYDPDGTGFEATATPKGAQSGDRCGTLSVDAAGRHEAANDNCW